MNTPNTGSGPERDDSQWTDDTLPLGVRRELLDRELAALIARKRSAQSHASNQAHADQGHPHAEPPEAGHPGAHLEGEGDKHPG